MFLQELQRAFQRENCFIGYFVKYDRDKTTLNINLRFSRDLLKKVEHTLGVRLPTELQLI